MALAKIVIIANRSGHSDPDGAIECVQGPQKLQKALGRVDAAKVEDTEGSALISDVASPEGVWKV